MGNVRSGHELTALLTTGEVLDCLNVTPRTIYRLIRSGELPAVRIGRQWRFRPADLIAWLDRQQASASS
jgi:excisionase family DNA binding protein